MLLLLFTLPSVILGLQSFFGPWRAKKSSKKTVRFADQQPPSTDAVYIDPALSLKKMTLPLQLGVSSWKYSDQRERQRILVDSESDSFTSLVRVDVGVASGQAIGFLGPGHVSIYTTQTPLDYADEYNTVTHYVHLDPFIRDLPNPPDGSDIANKAMVRWANHLAVNPRKHIKENHESFNFIRKALLENKEAYAPLLVGYSLREDAEQFLKELSAPPKAPQLCDGQKKSENPQMKTFFFRAPKKPRLRVDLFFDLNAKAFRIFSLHQDDEGMSGKGELASINITYLRQLTLFTENYNDIRNSTSQLIAYGRHIAATRSSNAQEFGIKWPHRKSPSITNERKSIVLLHAYVSGWPDYLKGYEFD